MVILPVVLVWISGEEFPRLKIGGRLVWLGDHGRVTNYHDPEADSETCAVGEDTDDTYEEHDEAKWCPPLPAAAFITKSFGE